MSCFWPISDTSIKWLRGNMKLNVGTNISGIDYWSCLSFPNLYETLGFHFSLNIGFHFQIFIQTLRFLGSMDFCKTKKKVINLWAYSLVKR